uniref:Tail tape measure protein n=1 Tax=Dulem virus 31 TaxID=3145749 RepID=A0AAU8ATB8_9VIRU
MAVYQDTLILKDQVSNSLEKINKNFEKINKAGDKAGKSVNFFQKGCIRASKMIERLNKKLQASQESFEQWQKKTAAIKKLGDDIKNCGNNLTMKLTLPIVGLGTAMAKTAMDFESMQQQLSVMLGSTKKGEKMFKDITDFASHTPLETKDIMDATNTMLSFGISSDKVLKYQRQLGDIAGGNKERFQSLALAFSQASSAGKLQGQDLLQMINAGFNPLEQIAKRTGKTVGYWKDMMSKGAVTMDMVTQAMEDATSEGGRYYNMMDKMSKTASGQWSTLMDNLNMTLAQFGTLILPYVIKGIEKLSKAFEYLQSLTPAQKKLILVVGGFLALLGPAITTIGSLITSILTINKVLWILAGNPVALTILGWTAVFAGLVAGIWAVIKAIQILRGQLEHNKRMKINSLNTNFDDEQLGKLSKLEMSMGHKAFAEKFKNTDIPKRVTEYRKKQITNNTTYNNFSGNIQLSKSSPVNDLLFAGLNTAN